MRVCMCKCGYVTWAGVHCRSWWSRLWSVPPASACTSWIDHGSRHSGSAPRQMAGAIKATGEKNNCQQLISNWRLDVLPKHINVACVHWYLGPKAWANMCPYLSWVLIGRSEGAVGVSGVQTGSIHVAVPDICLFQHVLKAFHGEVCPPQVLKELLGVKVGPLQRVFTSVNLKVNTITV